MIEAFVAQAEKQPDAPALLWQGETTTYRELLELAEKVVLPEDVILAKKSPDAVARVLACLLARKPFLLPSPALPEETLNKLFAQTAEAKVGEDTCFMLTTSGSTGLPKIVPLTIGAVSRFTEWAADAFDIRPGTTVLNHAPLNFDLCLLDIWTTLAHGGCVVLVDPDRAANGRYLLDLLVRHKVQVVQAVPMFFTLVLDAADASGQRLPHTAHVMFTGDVMPDRTLSELPRIFPTARLYNIYGCTETNDSFIYEVDPTSPVAGPVPLGEPLPGVEFRIVEDELYVSTPFQTAGYLQGPNRFLDGYFRSGDLVRRHEDGELYLVGRSDFQVKVRGVAINTAEVERVLLDHPEVLEAAVVARPDQLAGRSLACLVQRAPGSRLNSLTLREHCARRLPQAGVPSAMRIVDTPLPKTSTGKVDRNAV